MPKLDVHFGHTTFSDQQLTESIESLLDNHNSLAMATIKGDESYINTIHYGYNSSLELIVLTQPYTQHSRNVDSNPSVAVAIWNTPPAWGTDLQGMQLFGTCERVPEHQLVDAMKAYTQRIPAFGDAFKVPADISKTDNLLWVIKISRLKLLDEPRFGRRNYITLEVQRS